MSFHNIETYMKFHDARVSWLDMWHMNFDIGKLFLWKLKIFLLVTPLLVLHLWRLTIAEAPEVRVTALLFRCLLPIAMHWRVPTWSKLLHISLCCLKCNQHRCPMVWMKDTACLKAAEVKKIPRGCESQLVILQVLTILRGVANSLTVGRNDKSKKKRLPKNPI